MALSISPELLAFLVFAGVILLQIAFTSFFQISQENRRRLQHASTGQALVCISYVLPPKYCQFLLGLGCILIVYVRFMHDSWYRERFHSLLRPYELQYGVLPGAFYFLLGTLIVSLAVDVNIARYSVLCASYADPIAAWVGSNPRLGQYKIHSSASIAGCMACFATAWVIGIIMLPENDNPRVPVIGAVACMVTEALPYVNDNLVIPIATAAAVQWSMSF